MTNTIRVNRTLKKLTKEEINKIIKDHQHFVKHDCEGWENMRADFSHTDLQFVDLSCSVLRGATFQGAHLAFVNLYASDLCDVDFSRACLMNTDLSHVAAVNIDFSYGILKNVDLSYANLKHAAFRSAKAIRCNFDNTNMAGANLCKSDFRKNSIEDANLCNALLSHASLAGADLRHSNLVGADLTWCDLVEANLFSADLRNADPWKANLFRTNLAGAEIDFKLHCPDTGSFIGWKKAARGYIVKLEILEDAKRSSATGRKCRCDKARVLAIKDIDGTVSINEVCSNYDPDFIYKVGEVVSVENFDENRWNECAPGIHFFMSRDEAVQY